MDIHLQEALTQAFASFLERAPDVSTFTFLDGHSVIFCQIQ